MNAIIFHMPPFFRLTGSLINAIEYFLCAVEYNPELKLIILNGVSATKSKIVNLIQNRYDHLDKKWIDNIVCIVKYMLVHEKFDTALVVDYGTIRETKGILNAKKIIVISEKYTERPECFYDKSKYNVEYYGEMPFHYKDVEYRMKCLFDKYKPLRDEKEGTFINSPYNEDIDSLELMWKGHVPNPIFFKNKYAHKENLFENFTHYVYYHSNKWFDPHPRLFLECFFYEKYMIYHNPYKIKDGSWYRHNDLLERGLWNRTLTKDDEIICQMI